MNISASPLPYTLYFPLSAYTLGILVITSLAVPASPKAVPFTCAMSPPSFIENILRWPFTVIHCNEVTDSLKIWSTIVPIVVKYKIIKLLVVKTTMLTMLDNRISNIVQCSHDYH